MLPINFGFVASCVPHVIFNDNINNTVIKISMKRTNIFNMNT